MLHQYLPDNIAELASGRVTIGMTDFGGFAKLPFNAVLVDQFHSKVCQQHRHRGEGEVGGICRRRAIMRWHMPVRFDTAWTCAYLSIAIFNSDA